MSAVLEEKQHSSSLAALRPQPAPESRLPAVSAGFFDLQSFELMQRVAKGFASSSLVPKEYVGNVANCMIALNLARRINGDPLMVMQSLTIVHGRPTWSSQFMIATANMCGRFTALRFEFFGAKGADDWGCRAWALEKSTGEKLTGSDITIALAKKEGWHDKNGSKWKSMPQQMLMYRAGAWWVRAYAPELSMGLMAADEAGDVYNAAPGADGSYAVTTEELRTVETETSVDKSTGEMHDASTAMQSGEDVTDSISGEGAPKVEFAKLKASLESRGDLETLDADASLIGAVEGADDQNKLAKIYKERRKELAK